LTTLASHPPPNLKIFVFDNEAYEGTGSQPTATAGPTDIAAIARGAGVRDAQSVSDLESFQKLARAALTTRGLAFIVAKVELAKVPSPKKRIPPREALTRFVRYVEATEKISILHTEVA
jgi:sulfopyruvate decarboxylase subunit beta